ncbi:MAG: hypothetical protein JRH20_09190 [Deltaproteobacteria bacterium]|nr:hypothetical protein [Deltaproteobacteria bacterium]
MFRKHVQPMVTMMLALIFCAGTWASPSYARAEEVPAVRAEAGNLGLSFTFGGLATTTTGTSEAVNALIFSQVGLRMVLNENLIFPIYLGFGTQIRDRENVDAETDFGLRLGGGLEYHFRIWRRISPFVGGGLLVAVDEPAGDSNWTFGFAITPTMGVEYYIADRVSLIAQYYFNLIFTIQDPVFDFQMGTASGGALTLALYF